MAAATEPRLTPRECTKRPREKPCAEGGGSFSSPTSRNNRRLWWFWFFFRFLFFGFLPLRFFLHSLGRVGFCTGLFRAFAASFGFLFGGLLFFFKQRPLLFFEPGTPGDVALAVEIDAAIDQSFLDDGVGAERIVVVNHEVGILSNVDRAGAFVDAELDRRIQGHELQCLIMREAAILHALRRFLIQVRGLFGVVGIDGDHHAAARHQRRVVGNRVVGFHFISPPIGERGSARARCGNFIRNFIALQYMLESPDLEPELLCHAQQHEDFVFAVAMRVHVALAFQNFDERVEAEIAARRNEIFFSRGSAFVVAVPGFLVVAGFRKSSADRFFNTHPRHRIAPRLAGDAEIRALGVFAKRKLNAGKRAFERELRGWLAPAKLDDYGLSSDRVRRAVKNIRSRDPTRKIPVDIDVVGIKDLRDVYDGRDGDAAFVDAAVDGDVRVAIDDAGMTYWPAASMTCAFCGAFTDWPTSAILPSLMRIEPCSMAPCETVRMVAF